MNKEINQVVENLTRLYLNGRISLQDVFDIKFSFPENGILMSGGIAGFVENKPVIVICPESEFTVFINSVRNEIYKEPFLIKVFRFLVDVFGR